MGKYTELVQTSRLYPIAIFYNGLKKTNNHFIIFHSSVGIFQVNSFVGNRVKIQNSQKKSMWQIFGKKFMIVW
jgi:hypothetical protein